MTRTERATSPRALLKDRSESRSGMDKHVSKNGAGAHSWGSMQDEYRMEMEGEDDADYEERDATTTATTTTSDAPKAPDSDKQAADRPRGGSVSVTSDEDREQARDFRAKALKKGQNVDLAAIARTSSAVSGSPPKANVFPKSGNHDDSASV